MGTDYLLRESLRSVRKASSTVVMNCAGKIMVEFFSVDISDHKFVDSCRIYHHML